MKEKINRSYEEIVDKISRIICDECVIEFENKLVFYREIDSVTMIYLI